MVDPISLIGTAGSVANIIDVVTKTIDTIRELANEYNFTSNKDADLRFFSLVSQLTALRAAFDKILERMDMDLSDPHQRWMCSERKQRQPAFMKRASQWTS